MKRSPLGLDLYLWFTYRMFTLKAPLRLSWRQLYRQFGVDPAKAGDKSTLSNFRSDCLRELKKINRSWPDLHYQTVTGTLVLSPSPPRIQPPAQLRARPTKAAPGSAQRLDRGFPQKAVILRDSHR